MTTEMINALENKLQSAIDAIRDDDESMRAAKVLIGSQAFMLTSPSLCVWLTRVFTDGGHYNEKTINVSEWSDLDVAAGLGSSVALSQHSATLLVAQATQILWELFSVATSTRLILRALERLQGAAE